MNPSIQLKKAILLFLVALTCLALSPQARAVCQDACLTNDNTVQGDDALINLTTGSENTANGSSALHENTTGDDNTAVGFQALFSNTTGNDNTAIGIGALVFNTTGSGNTATGVAALASNIAGRSNTATGGDALLGNRIGNNNTASGAFALVNNFSGSGNTATGFQALFDNNTGESNTATGNFALANNSGSNNIALGADAGSHLHTGDNNIDIGNQGVRDESNTIRFGTQGTQTKTFIAGISDAAIGGMEVRVNQNGRLGTVPSSKRFKEVIKAMDKASEVLLALRPVTFRYKPEIDPEGIPQFGLVAEEVEKVNPDLVVRDKEGKPYTVRYEAVNAMLLNEFLKEHRKNEEQQATIAQLKSGMEALTATVREQAAQIQKVSAQLEASKPAPRVVNNNQ